MKVSDTTLACNARERAEAELRSGEELQWVGTYGKLPRGAVSMLFIVDLIAVVLVVAVAVLLWREVQSITLTLICGVCGIGVLFLSYVKIRERRKTVYMLTNHRVVWLGSKNRAVRSMPLTENMVRRVVMKPQGCGDIVFATAEDDESCVFYNVPRVRVVLNLINELSAGR